MVRPTTQLTLAQAEAAAPAPDAPAPLSEDEACKRSFVMAVKDALNVVSGKWKLAIVCTLLQGPRRFNDIERLLLGLSPRVLAKELRDLEVNGVVERIPLDRGTGPAGRGHAYRLTPSGQQLQTVILGMADWGVQHRTTSAQVLPDIPAPARQDRA